MNEEKPTLVITRNDIDEFQEENKEKIVNDKLTLWVVEKRQDLLTFYFDKGLWIAHKRIYNIELPLNCYQVVKLVPGQIMVVEINEIGTLEYSQKQTETALKLMEKIK